MNPGGAARLAGAAAAALAALAAPGAWSAGPQGAAEKAAPPAAAAPPGADAARSAAATALLEGVDAVATAGVPGPLAIVGPRAFALVAGREGRDGRLPVVAGGEWERGRVVAFGHGGMIGADALRHPGTRRLVLNAVRWLGAAPVGPDPVTVGVVHNDAMAALLRAEGMTVETLPRPAEAAFPRLRVLVVDAHSLRAEDLEPVAAFVRAGGGLLTAGLGWGWLQTHPGRGILEHPGNVLLGGAGIAWCDGTLDPTAPGAFAVEAPQLLSAVDAVERLDAALAGNAAAFTPQCAVVLTAAVRVLPEGHPMLERLSRIAADHAAVASADVHHPLRAKEAAARALVALQTELAWRTPPEKVRAHPSAEIFPGRVPADAPRVTRRSGADRTIPGWHGTGLYAAPGEVITVTPAGPVDGASVRIGCHNDQLWHLDTWRRMPEIAREWPLRDGPLRVASPFGGPVYLVVPKRGSGSLECEIAGAVEAPRFVLGTTTPEEWAKGRTAPAPWGELESRKVILSLPSEALRTLDGPEALMGFWDRVSDAHATLAGVPIPPARPHRFVPDEQISAGYMHSGYPIMTHLDAVKDMANLERMKRGPWGLLHELGHNHQQGEWTFGGTTEVTCNLFALHAIDTICTPPPGSRGHEAVDSPPSVAAHVKAGAPFERWRQEPFLALEMYVELQRAFGWEPFKRVFAEYRDLPAAERPASDDQKRDQWMVRFSRAVGVNLGPFFQAWGVPTSEAARASISSLPAWMPEGWPPGQPG